MGYAANSQNRKDVLSWYRIPDGDKMAARPGLSGGLTGKIG
jgi:hypothetical protein